MMLETLRTVDFIERIMAGGGSSVVSECWVWNNCAFFKWSGLRRWHEVRISYFDNTWAFPNTHLSYYAVLDLLEASGEQWHYYKGEPNGT
jgi:hypothetical protein